MAITVLFLQLSLSLSSSQATLLLYSSGSKQTLNYSAVPKVGSQQDRTLSLPHGVSSAETAAILGPGVRLSSQHNPSLSTTPALALHLHRSTDLSHYTSPLWHYQHI